jgi:hypothetical protein
MKNRLLRRAVGGALLVAGAALELIGIALERR